ncbi:MAG: glycosyl hydrolase family 5 [Nitrosomonadales bacterium]|nr:glycosyl hydrolase family 5 [Nitrosomonadales bacterium]
MLPLWFRRVVVTVALLWFAQGAVAGEPEWANFKLRFMEADGRVVDHLQGDISHSEGQGFAMLLAVHYGDRDAFDHLWQWTQQHLQVREDNLLAWRWHPDNGITDKNNASDGDLLVAWSLLRADERWHVPAYMAASQKIALDIREKLFRKTAQGLVLLPGIEGFEKPEGITINLSYWVFPALREIGRADPAPEWEELTKTGLAILQYARFGRWGLPPDWLQLGVKVKPGSPERFSYDAVRIPLYLLWGRQESEALLKPYRDYWGYFGAGRYMPAWTNFNDDSVDSYEASAGIRAVARWVTGFPYAASSGASHADEQQGYYSTILILLSKMAIAERGRPVANN